MMRKNSLHITEDDLARILKDELKSIKGIDFSDLSKRICMRGNTHSLSHRQIYVTNDKLLKKADKINLSNKSDAGLFANLLTLIRRQNNHRGITTPKPGDTEWLIIRELSDLAKEFCQEFGLSIKEGYKAYISTAIPMMKKYSINKMKGMHGGILNKYEAIEEIKNDKYPELTREAYEIYTQYLDEKSGFNFTDYKKETNPEKYVCFKRCGEDCKKIKAEIKIFITAQFEWMGNKTTVPDPLQLYGEKAIERVRKFMVENSITLKDRAQKKINFKEIKNGRGQNHT